MAALAYLLPPWTGLVALLKGREERTRAHGLQSVALGLVFPAVLYLCSWVDPVATRVAFVAAAVLWLLLLLVVALGRDPLLPGLRNQVAER